MLHSTLFYSSLIFFSVFYQNVLYYILFAVLQSTLLFDLWDWYWMLWFCRLSDSEKETPPDSGSILVTLSVLYLYQWIYLLELEFQFICILVLTMDIVTTAAFQDYINSGCKLYNLNVNIIILVISLILMSAMFSTAILLLFLSF